MCQASPKRRWRSPLKRLRALIRRAAANAGKCGTCSAVVAQTVDRARHGGNPALPADSGYTDEDLVAELCCVVEDAAAARRMHTHDLGRPNELLEAVLADDSARQLQASDGTVSGLGADLIALAALLEGPRTAEGRKGVSDAHEDQLR